MIDIKHWMKQYQDTVLNTFAGRVLFIGLQGSFGRGEANEHSDIDVILILDAVSFADLSRYRQAIENLPDRARLCGFVSGKEELMGWCKSDLFQFYHDAISYYGNLDELIPAPTVADARVAVLLGACNLYHMCSHNYLHTGDLEMLKGIYKAAVFTLQAKQYTQTGHYIASHSALKTVLSGTDLQILLHGEQLKKEGGSPPDLARHTELMLQWTHQLIGEYAQA